MENLKTKVWASKSSIIGEIADVPDNWLDKFAAAEPQNIRKFTAARNSRLVYRVAAILAAIEARKYFQGLSAGGNAAAATGEGFFPSSPSPVDFSTEDKEGGAE